MKSTGQSGLLQTVCGMTMRTDAVRSLLGCYLSQLHSTPPLMGRNALLRTKMLEAQEG